METFIIRPTQIRKLFTLEDRGNIHKTLGGIALVHYAYRFKNWCSTGSMDFQPGAFDTALLILAHASLSLSSLGFRLPAVRNKAAPMIWPEFRLHSIVFAMRSLVVMLSLWARVGGPWLLAAKCSAIFLAMFLADEITRRHPPQGSTMRAMKFPDWASPRWISAHNRFYSVCQIYATLELLFRDKMSYAFAILFPIQMAAFLMTCVRKGIITSAGWHFWYTVALLTTAMHSITSHDGTKVPFFIYHSLFLAATGFRFRLGVNKYVLWMGIVTSFVLLGVE